MDKFPHRPQFLLPIKQWEERLGPLEIVGIQGRNGRGTEVSGTALGLDGASNGTCTGTGRGHSVKTAALALPETNTLTVTTHALSPIRSMSAIIPISPKGYLAAWERLS